jgi:hypothetical protein
MVTQNILLEALRERIMKLLNHGLDKVWLRATENDDFHVANVIGIPMATWNECMPHTTLMRKDGTLLYDEWSKKLHLKIEFAYVQQRSSNTDPRQRNKWFRFTGTINVDEPRAKRRRPASTVSASSVDNEVHANMTPRDDVALEYLHNFYEKLEEHNLLIDIQSIWGKSSNFVYL